MTKQAEPPLSVFDRVVVYHATRGGTRVFWELLDTFPDPNPLTFQLQFSRAGHEEADDWVDVGPPVVNRYSAVDPQQRDWGVLRSATYRVRLATPEGTYFSRPTWAMGVLDKTDWLKAKEITRQADLGFRKGHSAQRGWLLKRRWTGTPCGCVDPGLNVAGNPSCSLCYGTGYRCGYYYPMSCVWVDIEPTTKLADIDQQGVRNSIVSRNAVGLMLGGCLASAADVWVSSRTDDRYFIDQATPSLEIRGIPILLNVSLRVIPFTNVVYTVPVPDPREEA